MRKDTGRRKGGRGREVKSLWSEGRAEELKCNMFDWK